ncbi:Long-chain-fatty-acid--CoA ligase FadD13 [Brevundimonas sp. SH203]|uniref:acyl-CoA synthetase n=1 Tax=Brevundimonas sp. SH203 TaxID=345167 RepID=UPI0009CCD301|nr:acyl-CoA synthetase [Brevundimonas sp. SH203]GAW41148.1 Long-chain-fatty-acid--CoA ligase FadD13 [Brevundimonas sp. SH203]
MAQAAHPLGHARRVPDKPACILAETGEAMTYAQLEAAANQGARLMRALGLKRGDVVAVVLDNGFDTFRIAWAAQRIGVFLTSLSTKSSIADLTYILKDADARLVIASDGLAENVREAAATLDIAAYSITGAAGLRNWTEERSALSPDLPQDAEPGTDMLYSSGTTGRPKGVRPTLPTGPLDASTPLMAMGRDLYGMDQDTVYLSTSPLYHAAPLRWAMTVHRFGGAVVIMRQFDPEQALAHIERYRITASTWVPTHFVRMLKLPEAVRARCDMSSMTAVIHAAAPCPVPVKQAMIDWWGPIIHEYYSGTETCGITALSAQEWLAKPGSVGRAVLGKVRILNAAAEELPVGEVGEVFFSDGPAFAYHNDPEKTAQAHSPQGWATLGDIGHLDADGYLFLTDRKGFMIISGGVNIYPQEIENLLITHPDVADVAVIGAPDEEMGERVVAVVQPVRWSDAGPELAQALTRMAREQLGGVKTPRQIDFRQTLPREPTGKLLKRLIRDDYHAKDAPS